jgi:hypothetical protein
MVKRAVDTLAEPIQDPVRQVFLQDAVVLAVILVQVRRIHSSIKLLHAEA